MQMLLPNKEYSVKPSLRRRESYIKQFTLKHRYLANGSLDNVKIIPQEGDFAKEPHNLIKYGRKTSLQINGRYSSQGEFNSTKYSSGTIASSSKDFSVHTNLAFSEIPRIPKGDSVKYLKSRINPEKIQNQKCVAFSDNSSKTTWNSSVSQIEISHNIAKSEITKFIPKFSKKRKIDEQNDFLINYITTGSPIPMIIKEAINHLYENAHDLDLIFRKNGSATTSEQLYQQILNQESVSLKDYNDYVIASVVSKYFRNRTDSLFTQHFSNYLHSCAEENRNPTILRDFVILLPQSNREVLVLWIRLLNRISKNSEVTHMSPYNLSVCLCETIFSRKTSKSRPLKSLNSRMKEEMAWKSISIEYSEILIAHYEFIFEMEEHQQNIRFIPPKNTLNIVNRLISTLYENVHFLEFEEERSIEDKVKAENVELRSRKFGDSILKIWKCSTLVKCDAKAAINQLFSKKIGWFARDLHHVSSISEDTEIVTLKEKWIVDRICYMLWHKQRIDNNYTIVGKSLDHSNHGSSAVADCLFFAYYLEPKGKYCQLTHFLSVDTKGRSLQWNNTVLGSRLKFYIFELRKTLESI